MVTIIVTHLEVYISLKEINLQSLNVASDNSTSFKYKASLLGKATDADSNDRLLKKCKNSCSTEIFT